MVKATVDEALSTGELIEEGSKIRVNFAMNTEEQDEEVPEEETKADKKKRRTKRPAMKKGAKLDEIEEDVEVVEVEPETPRRGRKRAREASPTPKKRGRPAKRAKTEEDVTETPRRGRGRPPKNKKDTHMEVEEEEPEVVEETPKRRGRPSKKGKKSPRRDRSESPVKSKESPAKSKESPSKTKTPSKLARGEELDLPKGWRVEEVERKGGRTKGATDKYWYSPEGIKFRSRVAVLRHLEEQQ